MTDRNSIVILDADTFGVDVSLKSIEEMGTVQSFGKTPASLTAQRIRDANIVITNKVILDDTLMASAPNLKLICIAATGLNNVDLDGAKKRDIAVYNVAGYSTESVVQHTFALYFHLAHNISYYDHYVKSLTYSKSDLFTHFAKPFHELAGRTWGVIGLGNIGRRVLEVAESFGMNTRYYSTSGRNSTDDFLQVDLDDLLICSDILSVHAPLNDSTKNLINRDRLELMKRNAILINMARGGIINEHDLARCLDEGRIAGAALDVMEKEPLPEENPLLHLKHPERIVFTPHMAWASVDSRQRVIDLTARNISAFLSGDNTGRVV